MPQLSLREQAFKAEYLKCYKPYEAALAVGYSDSCARKAWSWVSITGCPQRKRALRDAIFSEMEERAGIENINSKWVLDRAKLLADFNIFKFIEIEDGKAVYNFTEATADDWYCIEEYTSDMIYQTLEKGKVEVSKIRLKPVSKIQALRLVGDHVKVQAFKELSGISGDLDPINLTKEEYKKAREEMLRADDF